MKRHSISRDKLEGEIIGGTLGLGVGGSGFMSGMVIGRASGSYIHTQLEPLVPKAKKELKTWWRRR